MAEGPRHKIAKRVRCGDRSGETTTPPNNWPGTMKYFTRRAIDIEIILPGEGLAGGIVTFVGTPRANSGNQKVLFLEYEAYETMAERLLDAMVLQARGRGSSIEVFLQHRLGKVPVGEASVYLRVSARHRHEAFSACQFLIDGLKREVPIWKKEVYREGEAKWGDCELSIGTCVG